MLTCVVPSDIPHCDFQLPLSRKLIAMLQENQAVEIHAVFSFSTWVIAVVIYEVVVNSHDHALLLERLIYNSRVFSSSHTQISYRIDVGLSAEHWPQFSATLVEEDPLLHFVEPNRGYA